MSAAFQIFTLPSQQALDASARVRAGARLYFYLTGTSTPADAYADSGLTTPIANPLTADSGGVFAQFFLDPDVTYRILLKNSAGATLQTWDPANEDVLSANRIGIKLYPRTVAEISAGVTPVNYSYAPGNAWRHMTDAQIASIVAADLIEDVTTALQNWLAVLGELSSKVVGLLPAGTYKYSSGLTVPDSVEIEGDGTQVTILRPTSAVTTALTLSNNAKIARMQIDGTSTSDKTGLRIAPSTSDFNEVYDVWVVNFTGDSGIAVLVNESVSLAFYRLLAQGSGTNVKISSAAPGSLPTTVCFDNCRIRQSTKFCGVLINSGQNIQFVNDCIIENNKQQGILAQTGTGGKIEDLLVQNAWFEDNWFGHVDTGTRVYSVEIDGTTGDGCNAHLDNIRFTQGGSLSDRKSVLVNNATCSWRRLRGYYGFAYDFSVLGGTNSYVQIIDDAQDRCVKSTYNATNSNVLYPIYSKVIDNGDGTSKLPGTWQAWTPTYSSSVGNAAATFTGSGTVTTTRARYVVHGKICYVTVVFSATLNAVVPSYLALTLPTGITPQNSDQYVQASVTNAGTSATGLVQARTDGTLRIFKDNPGGNYTSGGAVGAAFTFALEIS